MRNGLPNAIYARRPGHRQTERSGSLRKKIKREKETPRFTESGQLDMQCYQSVPVFPTDTSLAFGHGYFDIDYHPFDNGCDLDSMQITMSSQCGSSGEESGDETHGRILTNSSILDSQSEAEKLQIRKLKAARRKERNKEAARKSNQAKKTFRDNLQKKSVELLEQKLQLEQDIKDLRNQLNHYALLYNHITHVCDHPQHGSPPQRRL